MPRAWSEVPQRGRGFERRGPTRALQRDTESASSEGDGVDLTVGPGLLSGASQISSSSKDLKVLRPDPSSWTPAGKVGSPSQSLPQGTSGPAPPHRSFSFLLPGFCHMVPLIQRPLGS